MLKLALPPSAPIGGGDVTVNPHLPAVSGAAVTAEEDSVQALTRMETVTASAIARFAQRDRSLGTIVPNRSSDSIERTVRSKRYSSNTHALNARTQSVTLCSRIASTHELSRSEVFPVNAASRWPPYQQSVTLPPRQALP